MVHDEARRIVFVSPAVEQVLGVTPDEIIGTTTVDLIHPDDLALAADQAEEVRGVDGAAYRSVLRVRHAREGWVWVEIVGRNLLHDPVVRGVVSTLRDVSEQRATEDRLRHEAGHDALTGLANRNRVDEHLEAVLEAPSRDRVAVVYLDLDGFKGVNDDLGHAVGDEVLRIVGRRLARAVRDTDLAGRLGGDEFVVVCGEVADDGQALAVAHRLHESLRGPARVTGRPLDIRVSLGVARPVDGDDGASLLASADRALYAAKEAGRDRVHLYAGGSDPSDAA